MFYSYSLNKRFDFQKTNSTCAYETKCIFKNNKTTITKPYFTKKNSDFQTKIKLEICSNLPKAF